MRRECRGGEPRQAARGPWSPTYSHRSREKAAYPTETSLTALSVFEFATLTLTVGIVDFQVPLNFSHDSKLSVKLNRVDAICRHGECIAEMEAASGNKRHLKSASVGSDNSRSYSHPALSCAHMTDATT